MRNKLVWHQIFLFGGLAILVLLRILTGRMYLDLGMLWWMIGAIFGFLLIFTDRLVYILLVKEEPLSMKINEMTGRGDWKTALLTLITERHEQKQLAMRSVLFVMVWVVLAILAATSSANFFARGFMLGIGMHLIFDLVTDYLWSRDKLNLWFWQIKRQVPEEEKKMFVGIVGIIFLFLASTL